MAPECEEQKSDKQAIRCVSLMLLPHFDAICDLKYGNMKSIHWVVYREAVHVCWLL